MFEITHRYRVIAMNVVTDSVFGQIIFTVLESFSSNSMEKVLLSICPGNQFN